MAPGHTVPGATTPTHTYMIVKQNSFINLNVVIYV